MKKFEKITLVTCIDTYGSTSTAGMTALDELVQLITKHATEVTLIDYDNGVEYELVEKAEEVRS
jgi:predicted metal-dependent peptidase